MVKKNKTTQKKASFEKKIRRSMMLLILVIIISIVGNVLFMFYKIAQSIENSNTKTGNAVVQISSETNDSQIRDKLMRLTEEKANEANEGFRILKYTVNIIKENAELLYENEDDYGSVKVYPPLKNNADVLSVQVTYSASVNPNDSAIQKEQGLIGNLGALLYSINDNNSRISSCYIATESGIMLQADKLAAYQFDESGKIMTFEAKERPWYKNAAKSNSVYFTDAVRDADTGEYAIICSAPIYKDGNLVGVAGAGMYLTDFESIIANAKLSESGAAFIIDNNGNLIISTDKDYAWKSNAGDLVNLLNDKGELSDELSRFLSDGKNSISIINMNGKEYYISCSLLKTVGWGFASLLPVSEVNATTVQLVNELEEINKDTNSEMLAVLNIAIIVWVATIAVLIILITLYVRRMTARLLKPIKGLTKKVRAVDGDHLEFEWENRSGDEIDELGLSFLRMTESIKQYIKDITAITAEKERIGAELSVATKIQEDMLPIVFPAFPDREEFDVFATMTPAKEVGGDFYDFFFVDENHIALVIADVSGKGVPAALFMVIAKTLIKNRAQAGGTPSEILTDVNNQLCEGNREKMFVTVWLAIIDVRTGEGVSSNAGHEHPALGNSKTGFELQVYRHSPAISIMNNIPYRQRKFKLNPGDMIFVYTDGVAEATNSENELYGTDRMIKALNQKSGASLKEILTHIKEDIDTFVGDAEQFDDITMLAFLFKGNEETNSDSVDIEDKDQ